jgi:MoaA/NifB/PqqE/SkfB family radical SAM enzyme
LIQSVSWEFTNSCHLRCKTCLPASGTARANELTTAQCRSMLGGLAAAGVTQLLLTGGEPLFRSDFADVLSHAAALGMSTAVITSGTLGSRRALAAIRAAGARLSVSFDGAGPATHDLIRGHGTFARAVAACQQFASSGISFDLSVTISRPNVNELAEIALLGRDLGCHRVFFSEVSRAGRAAQNWELLALTASQHRGLPAAVAQAAHSAFGDESLAADDSCWVTGESLYINSQGRAFLCVEIAQAQPGRMIADLTVPDGIRRAVSVAGRARHGHRQCLDESFASGHVSLTLEHDRPCAVLALAGPAELGAVQGSTS